jgi:tyrosyl-tRNA synthetase
VNTEDAKVCEYLRKFTFLDRAAIEPLEAAHAANPGAREAHKALAREVTTLVHGPEALAAALKASEILFGGPLDGVTEDIFNDVAGEVPTKDLEQAKLAGTGAPIIDLIVHSGLENSKGAARKALEAGGIYLNNVRVTDLARVVTVADLLFGKYLLLRKGKKSYAVLAAK